MAEIFDIIVVGGGHAGTEAAAVAARMGLRTALVSFRREQIGAMSCNPAIGGLGKGHLVREVDAFDGLIARAADAAAIHYRMLNRSKGAAVRGPRVQADRALFKQAVHQMLGALAALTIVEGEVTALRFAKTKAAGDGDRVIGVCLADGSELSAPAVILATGTFLGGKLFRGEEVLAGGRTGEAAATRLAEQIRERNLPMARLKTGTPPRIDGRTIDWAQLPEQPSDGEAWTMSPLTKARCVPQLFCAISRTSARTHDIIRGNLHRSPLFSGAIDALGPRYCPSIEDKIHRFADRDSHQVFLEPEGLSSHWIYPNGISTSLPADVQRDFVRSMAGMADAEIVVPGYAVEYDHIDPRSLDRQLQVKAIPGLYCAGQINGTTGYEEAAAQGLIAGLGAACTVLGREPVPIDRTNSYMAVMLDDLLLHGVTEPYRMLTARAEYRLRLRADNAATRLTPIATAMGCVGEERRQQFAQYCETKDRLRGALDRAANSEELARAGLPVKRDGNRQSLFDWLRFPDIGIDDLGALIGDWADYPADIREELAQDAHYAPYLKRQEGELRDLHSHQAMRLASDLDYRAIAGLSNEMVERLSAAQPDSMAAAARVRGITPAALTAILMHAKRRSAAATKAA